MPAVSLFSIKNHLDIHSWMVSSEAHLNGSYPVVITTESKSAYLGWHGFETFLQEVIFSHHNTP
jgi:hypothetical protein